MYIGSSIKLVVGFQALVRFAFQVYYAGASYQGFQRQPNGMTIENYLEMAFIKAGYINTFQHNNYIAASRTDTGVNALGNVFSLLLNDKPNLTYLNSFLPDDIIIWSIAEVTEQFSPRTNSGKHYRYVLPRNIFSVYDLNRIYEYKGTHDFSSFIRNHGAGQYNPVNTIQEIEVNKQPQFIIIDIWGNRFGREQIRRMIGFLMEENHKTLSPGEILRENHDIAIRGAPAEFLTLMNIEFNPGISWQYEDLTLHSMIAHHHDLVRDYVNKWQLIDNLSNLV